MPPQQNMHLDLEVKGIMGHFATPSLETGSRITWRLQTDGCYFPLTIIEVLQQVLLAREVQFGRDGDGDSQVLPGLQRQVRQRLLKVPA